MQRHPLSIPALILAVSVAGRACPGAASTSGRSPETLLKEGLYQEKTLRQPDLAAATYRKVIDAPEATPASHAEAHFRLGICLERIGRADQARRQFERVTRRFSDQTRWVERARRRLAVISASDPAMLMPPETLLYVELIRPGTQAERFIASLKGLDEAGMDRLLNRLGITRSLRGLCVLLGEVMREDLSRIDSVALGVLSSEDQAGRGDLEFLIVLHPGRSLASRGLLALMAQSAGEPSGGHGEVKLWALPGGRYGPLTFANVPNRPGLTGVMLLGKGRQVVCRAIDRWRAGAKRGGLASVPEFRRQAAARRWDSVVLVYADVPRILARLRRSLDPDGRTRYEAGRRLLALDAIERGMARLALLDNGVLFELGLMFNERANPLYAMLQTPPADRTLLGFVPTDTAAAVLMSVGRGRQKWDQIKTFLTQLSRTRRIMGGPDGLNLLGGIAEFESVTGLSVAEDLVGNCRSLAIIVPTIGPGRSAFTGSAAANIVLALRMHRPDEFIRRIEESLLDRLRAGMVTGQIAGVATRTYIEAPTASGAALGIARIGDVFLMTLSGEMLERVLRAYQRGDVMERSSLGRPAVTAVPPSASKIVLLRPELIIHDIRTHHGRRPLGFTPVRPVVAYTLEQSRQAALRVEIGDLTGLLNNVILAVGARAPVSATATAPVATTPSAGSRPSADPSR